MPNATIEVRRRYTPVEEAGIIDAVHAAMMQALKIPEWDKTVRLVVHEPHRFPQAPGKGERYILVDIDLFAGRSFEAKKALYQAIVMEPRTVRNPWRSGQDSAAGEPCRELGHQGRCSGLRSRLGFRGKRIGPGTSPDWTSGLYPAVGCLGDRPGPATASLMYTVIYIIHMVY